MELLRHWGFSSSWGLATVKCLVAGEVRLQWRSCDIVHTLPVDNLQIGAAVHWRSYDSGGPGQVQVLLHWSSCDMGGPARVQWLYQWSSCDTGGAETMKVMRQRRSCHSWGAATLEVLCQWTYCASRGTAAILLPRKWLSCDKCTNCYSGDTFESFLDLVFVFCFQSVCPVIVDIQYLYMSRKLEVQKEGSC